MCINSEMSRRTGLHPDFFSRERIMTDREQYLFDLQDFLVLRGVLDEATVLRINKVIDELEIRSDEELTALGASRDYRGQDSLYA